MKTCTKCKETKDLSNFTKDKQKHDGYRLWCKLCCKLNSSNYYLKHKECIKTYYKDYYHNNKDNITIKRRLNKTKHKAKQK